MLCQVIDAIIVGDSPDTQLRKLVTATGGECFQVHSLGGGFELLENEGVVSLRARRGGAPKPPYVCREVELSATREKAFTQTATLAASSAVAAAIGLASLSVIDPSRGIDKVCYAML